MIATLSLTKIGLTAVAAGVAFLVVVFLALWVTAGIGSHE
jgi:HAMP domain-containing protein